MAGTGDKTPEYGHVLRTCIISNQGGGIHGGALRAEHGTISG